MKKIFFNVASGVMFILALVGCQDDFLNTTPLSEVAESNVWSSTKLAEAAVLDLYQGTWAGTLSREETTDAFTDQAVFTHPGRGVDGYTEGKMNPSGSYIDFQWFSWTQIYPFIRSSNIAIKQLTTNEGGLEAGLAKRLLGEAYFMRAYFYTQLMRQFGGLVLLTEPLTLDSAAENPRSSFEATINLIIADVDQAISLLNDAPADKARAHKITALALKSRVLTHAASDLYDQTKSAGISTISSFANKELIGYTSGSQQQRWQAAKVASKALLDATTGYKLDLGAPASFEEAKQNYEDIWLQGDENQDFIWGRLIESFGFGSRTYDGGNEWSQGPGMVALYHGPNGYHEWAGTTPTEALASKYSLADGTDFDWNNPDHASDPYGNREARFYSTLLFDGAPWKVRTSDVTKYDNFNEIQTGYYTFKDGTIVNGVDTRQGPIEDWNGSRTGYYFKKFMDPYTPASWPNDLQKIDAPYVRYTEILLNYVEASINLGDEGEAKAWLNRLRFRNGLPEITASGSVLVEVYKRERDKELVNEDARLYDMKRWLEGPYSLDKQVQQILIQATQKSGSGMTPANYQKSSSDFEYAYRPTDIVFENRVWKDQVYFMPIPQAEIDRDPSIQQNPGY
jgi:hypothetical protein